MRNYRQFTREQIYQIYALMKAGLFKSQSPESLVSIGYINTLRMVHDCSLIAVINTLYSLVTCPDCISYRIILWNVSALPQFDLESFFLR